jgi:hypothetical protein
LLDFCSSIMPANWLMLLLFSPLKCIKWRCWLTKSGEGWTETIPEGEELELLGLVDGVKIVMSHSLDTEFWTLNFFGWKEEDFQNVLQVLIEITTNLENRWRNLIWIRKNSFVEICFLLFFFPRIVSALTLRKNNERAKERERSELWESLWSNDDPLWPAWAFVAHQALKCIHYTVEKKSKKNKRGE